MIDYQCKNCGQFSLGSDNARMKCRASGGNCVWIKMEESQETASRSSVQRGNIGCIAIVVLFLLVYWLDDKLHWFDFLFSD